MYRSLLVLALFPMSVVAQTPPGFTPLFNGKDLGGWHFMDTFDIRQLAAMNEADRAARLAKWAEESEGHWKVENGILVNDGQGAYLTTDKDYGDIELLVEYKTVPKADSGIYLRGCPQVQIWDHTDESQWKHGSKFGSGGLWNNSPGAPGKDPLVLADRPFGEWNQFRIIMVGERVTVYFNDKLVVDHARLENYFEKDRRNPVPRVGPIQLQTHGGQISWRNLYVREIPSAEANAILANGGPLPATSNVIYRYVPVSDCSPRCCRPHRCRSRCEPCVLVACAENSPIKPKDTGFVDVFNGRDFTGWAGPIDQYEVKDGAIVCKPNKGGTIYTQEEYRDFVVRVEYRLPPAGNNGLAIRYPGHGDTAYIGMCELQILDDDAPDYQKLDPRQFNLSAYGMVAAKRGYLRPTGEWNFAEATIRGSTIVVELNGTHVLDNDLAKVTDYMGGTAHPGKDRVQGHFGFAGHNDPVAFRNVQIKKLLP